MLSIGLRLWSLVEPFTETVLAGHEWSVEKHVATESSLIVGAENAEVFNYFVMALATAVVLFTLAPNILHIVHYTHCSDSKLFNVHTRPAKTVVFSGELLQAAFMNIDRKFVDRALVVFDILASVDFRL